MNLIRTALPVALAIGCMGGAHAEDELKRDGKWRAVLGLGASLSSGNTDASSLSFNGEAVRATSQDKTSLYAKANYAKSDGVSTAEQLRLSGRQDHDLSPRHFAFGGLDLENNRFANLKYRGQLSGGVGWHAIQSPTTTFDVFGGLGYTGEGYYDPMFIDGQTRTSYDYLGLLLGEESSHKLTESTSVRQRLTAVPNLSNWGQYRANWDGTLAVAINSSLNLTVGLALAYNSEPGPGRKTTDTLFTTGIAYKFQ